MATIWLRSLLSPTTQRPCLTYTGRPPVSEGRLSRFATTRPTRSAFAMIVSVQCFAGRLGRHDPSTTKMFCQGLSSQSGVQVNTDPSFAMGSVPAKWPSAPAKGIVREPGSACAPYRRISCDSRRAAMCKRRRACGVTSPWMCNSSPLSRRSSERLF
jgi:hypothetical protein